jgi:hypothetical protein
MSEKRSNAIYAGAIAVLLGFVLYTTRDLITSNTTAHETIEKGQMALSKQVDVLTEQFNGKFSWLESDVKQLKTDSAEHNNRLTKLENKRDSYTLQKVVDRGMRLN